MSLEASGIQCESSLILVPFYRHFLRHLECEPRERFFRRVYNTERLTAKKSSENYLGCEGPTTTTSRLRHTPHAIEQAHLHAGRYFGHKATILDKYGANLAAAPLPGQGHRVLHNILQSMVQSMMKVGGIYAEWEASNFLLEPWITQYVNLVTSHLSARNAPFAMCLISTRSTTPLVGNASTTAELPRRLRRSSRSKHFRHASAATITTTSTSTQLTGEPSRSRKTMV